MNRRKHYFAILVMAIATIIAAVVVSCKKETSNALMDNKTNQCNPSIQERLKT